MLLDAEVICQAAPTPKDFLFWCLHDWKRRFCDRTENARTCLSSHDLSRQCWAASHMHQYRRAYLTTLRPFAYLRTNVSVKMKRTVTAMHCGKHAFIRNINWSEKLFHVLYQSNSSPTKSQWISQN
jgi:hypothetical protein